MAKKKGLKSHTIVFMIAVALFYDVLQWLLTLLFMGWLAGIFAGLTFYVWFKLHGINFMKPKRFIVFGGASLIEMFPILPLSALPAWTAAVTYLALNSKLQEVIPGASLTKLGLAGTALNQNRSIAISGNKQTPIDVSRGAQEARNLERSRNREIIDVSRGAQEKRNLEAGRIRNRPIDISKGVQEARNLENSARNNRPIDIRAQRTPPANQSSAPSDNKNNGKTDSMSIHDELWELNAKPDLSKEDKERLQKAYWIMEHNQIEDKEKDDPVLLRAFERANRGEVIFDGSPEKRHGFKFSNVQIVNATNTIAGRDFDSLNPQYGNNGKK